MAVRILIVDRNVLFAEAISSALVEAEMDVVGVVSDGREAIAFLQRDQPDVIVMSLQLLDDLPIESMMKRRPFAGQPNDGMEMGRRIMKRWSDGKILLLSSWGDLQVADRALRAGFRAYLTKDSPLTDLVGAIQAIADGKKVLPEGLLPLPHDAPEDYADLLHLAEPSSGLTEEEKAIFELLSEGTDYRSTRRLGISRDVLRSYVQAIIQKLHVAGRFDV